MTRCPCLLLFVPFLAVALGTPAGAAEPDPRLAEQAFAVLKKHCHKCHGQNFEVENLDVLSYKSLLDRDAGYIVPGKPDDSLLWKRVGVKDSMPPRKIADRPSAEEKAVLRRWIEAGAPAPLPVETKAARVYRTERDVLTAVRDHLRQADEEDRRFLRYFTLTHLANNPAVSDRDLRVYRAALSKLANSLSWENDVVVPKPVDREETVFVVDLRDLGWDRDDLWLELLQEYPYGLNHDSDPDPGLRNAFTEAVELSRCDLPCIRADWFVNAASRPVLYHKMLRLPNNTDALEKTLRVNVTQNFLRNKLVRAGFPNSNVSNQNRLVERHRSAYGAYWKSYDFKPRVKNERGNLFELPLGPAFKDNPYPRQAFAQDGGEIIFNLPNGLQAYLLVNAKDERIDEGPSDVVGDSTKAGGTNVVINGLSCMACHNLGMKPFQDAVRSGTAVAGPARLKVQRLYPPQKRLDDYLKEDGDRFLHAAERATGRFLLAGEDRDADLRKLDEPVRTLADWYQKDLGAAEVAYELDVADPKELDVMIRNNDRLKRLGLLALTAGRGIKREEWELIKGTSLFQSAARALDKGSAIRPLKRD